MQDFQGRLRTEPIHPITEKLHGSGLVEATGFPIAVQALELMIECINHYNPDTKHILLPDQTVLISVDRQAVVNYLQIPEREEFSALTIGGAMLEFSLKKMVWWKEIMNSWFQKPRGAKSKVPKTLFGTDLKPEIVDILVLLHRLKGEVEAFNFIEKYFFLVQFICSDT
jgi:hypothetical protein